MPEPDQIAFDQACSELGLPLEPGETPAHWAFRYAAKRDGERLSMRGIAQAAINFVDSGLYPSRADFEQSELYRAVMEYLATSASQDAGPAISSTTQRQEEIPAEEDSLP